jgi:glycosyltransferase involved in cell wall biosynthesis
MDPETPFVSVVIPVYNGEEYIGEAIRSVLAQSYQNFDLTIGNNRSTDGTLAIAEEFAAKDPRIRVVTYPEFVSVVDSHNIAFTLVSDDAKYCKILGADDWLFPNCLEELVRVAEAHPSVGMVTSYMLAGSRVAFAGLPYPSTFMSGHAVCRLRLRDGVKVFGGPSTSLIRADIVRKQRPFYNPLNYHGDNEAYFELLKTNDFGFVHQILSYLRKGEASRTTSYLDRVNSYAASEVDDLTKFGPTYLTPQELGPRLRQAWRDYYRFLGRSVLEMRNREFWHYHLVHVRALGYELSYARIALHTVYRVADVVFNPLRTLQGLVRRLRERADRTRAAPSPSGATEGTSAEVAAR